MTDALVEDIYTVVYNARKNGQRDIPFHSFPFPMTNANIEAGLLKFPTQRELWRQLKVAYDAFESTRVPPIVSWAGSSYGVTARGGRELASEDSTPQRVPVQPREPVRNPTPSSDNGSGPFKYQVGAFGVEVNARRLVSANEGLEMSRSGGMYVVRSVQRFPSAEAARSAAARAGYSGAAAVRA